MFKHLRLMESINDKINDNESDDEQNILVDIEKTVIDASYASDETLEASAIEYFARFVTKKMCHKIKCKQCLILFMSENHKLTRQILIFFRAYETLDNQELRHLCVPIKEFSFVFKLMNATFDAGYPSIRGKYEILDILFPLIVQAVNMQYPGWFQHNTCSCHRKDLAYYIMKIKIHKNLIWLREKLKISKNRSQYKSLQKLINVQSM